MGWKLASVARFYRSTAPRALALVSACTSCCVSWELSNISSMGTVIMRYFSCYFALSYNSPHMKLMSFHVRACKSSTIKLNPLINLKKNYTKPKKNCTCYTVVGFGHFLRLYTLASLIHSPSGVRSNPRKVVVHCKKLHLFSWQ